jgi:hypothetical protein
MNSETPSTSIQGRRAGANPPAAITADRRMRLQDQRNSRDVVLICPSSAGLREAQPGPGSPARGAPAVPGTRAA